MISESNRVGWLGEVGIIRRDQNRWVPEKPKCDGISEFLTVGFAEIKPAIQILAIGYAISIAIAAIEILARSLQVQ